MRFWNATMVDDVLVRVRNVALNELGLTALVYEVHMWVARYED